MFRDFSFLAAARPCSWGMAGGRWAICRQEGMALLGLCLSAVDPASGTSGQLPCYPVSRAQRAVLQGPRTALAAHIRYKLDTFKCNRREGEKADVSEHIPLHTTQGHHFVKKIRVPASDGRQQLAVKAAESIAE